MAAEEVVSAYATALFIRSEAEIKRPVVLLTNERTNVFGVLEKHFRETALPPSERFWRAVRTQWTPALDTWRPRVNGVQLKVLAGARLPEGEEEWAALRAALAGVRQHLRADSSVDLLHAELRDFVGMVVDWWGNRKKTEGPNGMGGGGGGVVKRVPSAALLGGLPPAKRPCLEYLPLPPGPHLTTVYQSTVYAAPEIMPHALLAGPGGGEHAGLEAGGHEGSGHGGGGYLAALAAAAGGDGQPLYGPLFPGDASGGGEDAVSPHGRQPSGLLPPVEAPPAQPNGFHPLSPRERADGSADGREPGRAAGDAKVFVTLNVGGHRFLTTAATLGALPGSYFTKLAAQAASAAHRGRAAPEFFVDRSGKLFEYVLDYLRSHRFADSPSVLPRDERTLQLLAREAEFYRLHDLADRARGALVAAAMAAAPDPLSPPGQQQQQAGQAGLHALDALFFETGFCEASELGAAQAAVLARMNAALAARQAAGAAVLSTEAGTEREGPRRNLTYHVLLRCPASAPKPPAAGA